MFTMSSIRNFENRTLYHGDNLGFLRGLNSGSVDLIATDPPFKKGRDFHATPDSLASGARFQDRWSWERDVHAEWVDQIEDDWPGVWKVIEAARGEKTHPGSDKRKGDDMGAFLCFLGVRLIEMRRVLKDTGSIYVHCDPTANYYIRALMDGVFGRDRFRNEIVWAYRGGGVPRDAFARKHDSIFCYGKTSKSTFNRQFVPYSEASRKLVSGRGGVSIDGKERDLDRGAAMPDWWTDINSLQTWSPQRIGYPTQKPLALYERIIAASSNEGDVVLDPFCGCATTPIAAERLGRQWIGMDLWDKAHRTVLERLEQEGLAIPDDGGGERTGQARMITFGDVHYETEPPERTDAGELAAPFLYVPEKRALEPWERLSKPAIVDVLAKAQAGDGGVVCAGCGRVLEREFMHLDHRMPRAGGGENYITNRVLLCAPCNGRKGQTLTMPGLVLANRKAGWTRDADAAARADAQARASADRVRSGRLV